LRARHCKQRDPLQQQQLLKRKHVAGTELKHADSELKHVLQAQQYISAQLSLKNAFGVVEDGKGGGGSSSS
jgi:hypothetical protein